MGPLELWGGIECTVNRVNDRFHDQLHRSGHDQRCCDLERIAELGIRRLRYPVLWERTAPLSPDVLDWRWSDRRLQRLRELGIEPIVGLLHHGSGPRYTNLLDDRFPQLFAKYARAVADRYPWIRSYTPVNEPLTTARFSALYGIWYPHRRDNRSFVRALVNQCKATVLAMREIRKTNPSAQLIQTDDLGYTTSTAKLAYQASFDNERRWLGWDLLCGRVNVQHPLWSYLQASGLSFADAEFFREHACPPDIIGVNHYITSDRHLSEKKHLFPSDTWGGNGKHTYADIEAVRALGGCTSGLAGALRDAWERYRLPIAVTEVHLGCTREEQLRWLWQAWGCACELRAGGMDLRAVTPWALLGSFDWNSLLTVDAGYYEPGAFDVRGLVPRRTALAKLVTALARGAEFHPAALLDEHGWWQRSDRLFPSLRPTVEEIRPVDGKGSALLIAGAGEAIRRHFERACKSRGLHMRACEASEHQLNDLHPWAVVAMGPQASGDGGLASACARRSIPFLTFPSIDTVSVPDLVNAALDLLIDGEVQSWHHVTQAHVTAHAAAIESEDFALLAEPIPLPMR